MAIKVTLNQSATQSEKPFPKLMVSKVGTVVFFKNADYGMLIHAEKDEDGNVMPYPVGVWTDHWEPSRFSDIDITLQNA